MRLLFALFVILLPTAITAKDVTVRSGEHAGFSRLAFDFSDPINWVMGRVTGGYQIRFESSLNKVDISDVYRRISRERVSKIDISNDKASITLTIDCECYADAFEFRPGLLVIDIKDGIAPATSNFEKSFTSDEISKDKSKEPDEITSTRKTEILMNLNKHVLPVIMPAAHSSLETPSRLTPKVTQANQIDATNLRINKMRREMYNQIGHAASQGLLDASVSILSGNEDVRTKREPQLAEVANPVAPQEHINMRVETSIDREMGLAIKNTMITQDGDHCLPEKAFDLKKWGNPKSILEEIITQRASIYGEFDKINEQAVERLVKAYIYAGFGAEAENVLDAFDVGLKSDNILRMMARIIDGGKPQSYIGFKSQAVCDTNVALWAVLSMSNVPKKMSVNPTAVLSGFSFLPHHIRRLIGPRLSKKFLEMGDIDTARSIRNSIALTPGNSGPEFRLLDASLNQERGLYREAKQSLEQLVNEDGNIAPIALIKLLESNLSQNIKADNHLITTAETYVFEQKSTKIGADLQRLIALSRAKQGNLMLALKSLRELNTTEHYNETVLGSVWGEVLEIALVLKPKKNMLRFTYAAQDDLVKQNIPRDTLRKLSSALLDEGLIEIARKVIAVSNSPMVDDLILMARIEILSNNFKHALSLLEHISGPDAVRLRAEAYSKMGKHLDAADEYRSVQARNTEQIEIWRAGDWDQLTQSSLEINKIAANIMTEKPLYIENTAPTIDNIIVQYKILINESKKTRESLELLLEEYPSL